MNLEFINLYFIISNFEWAKGSEKATNGRKLARLQG